jgi:hypothetical protein
VKAGEGGGGRRRSEGVGVREECAIAQEEKIWDWGRAVVIYRAGNRGGGWASRKKKRGSGLT